MRDKSQDHPRVCGEHSIVRSRCRLRAGSSPRVRGTPAAQAAAGKLPGIIPACAGNTCPCRSRRCRSRMIPACAGNTCPPAVRWRRPWDDPPRVRGTRAARHRRRDNGGIIPACAGNTCSSIGAAITPRDHPRVCGEHHPLIRPSVTCPGSSPRVRGTPEMFAKSEDNQGIIPACAGNTYALLENVISRRDHPRVCGEHSIS